MERFTAILGGDAAERPVVEVPFDAKERFGQARAPVRGTVRGADFRAAFEGLSYTRRNEYARWIAEAKRDETRERRLEKAVAMLRGGARHP